MASDRSRKEETKKRGSREELWKLVDGIETAMMTTRRGDGMLVSRPMATQKRAGGADFWFVTLRGPKVEEVEGDPRVNLAYYRDRTREWVSVSGVAEISKDRAKIRELYAPDWRVWFPDEGGKKDGGPDDPRMVLIGVHARSAQYMTVDKPQPVLFFEFLKDGDRENAGFRRGQGNLDAQTRFAHRDEVFPPRCLAAEEAHGNGNEEGSLPPPKSPVTREAILGIVSSASHFAAGAFAASAGMRPNAPWLSTKNRHSEASSHRVVCR